MRMKDGEECGVTINFNKTALQEAGPKWISLNYKKDGPTVASDQKLRRKWARKCPDQMLQDSSSMGVYVCWWW